MSDIETRLALVGYRDAMTYVLQTAGDDATKVDEGLLKSLHFMMLKHDLSKNPGKWRPGATFVRRESAMAHLNLVMIHPFSDGNGRMARCLQTLVLARDQIVVPVFSSIEEFLGRNTRTYYEILGDVGEGSWHPQNDARPWVRFCLCAHFLQAGTLLQRRKEIEALWLACYDLTEKHGLAERCTAALMDAAYGFRIRRGSYQKGVRQSWDVEVPENPIGTAAPRGIGPIRVGASRGATRASRDRLTRFA